MVFTKLKLYRFLSAQHGLSALRDECLKVARFDELNDPFELYAAAMGEREHRAKFRQFKRWASDTFGLLCFCTSWKNPLLWSHYGEKHCGVALELEVNPDDVCPISYTPKRLLFDIEDRVRRGGFTDQDALKLATTKFAHWKYEDEVRVFVKLSECTFRGGMHFETFGKRLKPLRLVLGPMCPITQKDVQAVLPAGRKIVLTSSRLAFTSFNVVNNRAKPTIALHGRK